MSYEIEDWHDLGDFARSRYLQPDEEEEMSQPGAKRFEEWKKNYVEPKFTNGGERLVEEKGLVFFDLPPVTAKPRLVADTNWESVDACRRESVERLDRQQRGRIFAGVFWGVMVIASVVAVAAGAVYAVRALYSAVLN